MKNENIEAFARYLKDIKKCPRISLSREKYLANVISDKKSSIELKEKCRKELIEANLRLVVKIAISYYKKISKFEDVNISLNDLVQYGNIGLAKAADKYKYNSKTRFGTYAYVSVERHIVYAIKDSRMIRIPHQYFKYMKIIDGLVGENDSISNKDIASEINVTEKTLNTVKLNRYPKISIEKISSLVGEIVSKEPSPDEIFNKKQEIQYINKLINELKPKYKKVLSYRYLGDKEMTLNEVGKKLGITREAVRSIEKKAICSLQRKIKHRR